MWKSGLGSRSRGVCNLARVDHNHDPRMPSTETKKSRDFEGNTAREKNDNRAVSKMASDTMALPIHLYSSPDEIRLL